jgi:hypothetical protein
MSEINEAPPFGKTNTMAIISLISGILSLVFLLTGLCIPCTAVFSLLFGPLGAILGFISKKKIAESGGEETGRGLAIAGIVASLLGTIGAIVAAILFLLGVGLIVGTGTFYPEIFNFINNLSY